MLREFLQVPENNRDWKGLYLCPVCVEKEVRILPYGEKQIMAMIRLSTNTLLNDEPPLCPICRRPLLLSRVYDPHGTIILDSREVLHIGA